MLFIGHLTQETRSPVHRHEGPVWEVAWAHPKFGNLLASCSYDRKVRQCSGACVLALTVG